MKKYPYLVAIGLLVLLTTPVLLLAQEEPPPPVAPPTSGSNIADANIARLLSKASLVVTGTVTKLDYFYMDTPDGHLIFTDATVKIAQVEKGPQRAWITVRVAGGIDEANDIGLKVSEEASFTTVGEQVKLYLRPEDKVFRVVGGDLGKLSLSQQQSNSTATQCYVIDWTNGHKIKWYTGLPVLFRVNPTTFQPPETPTCNTVFSPCWNRIASIARGLSAWQNDPFYYSYPWSARMIGTTSKANGDNDGVNTIWMGSLSPADVLAEAFWWYTISTGQIVDANVEFSNGWTWYAGESTTVPKGQMDMQSVAAHEFGHTTSLEHVPATKGACGGTNIYNTMYPYLNSGDSSYRTLYIGDIFGINNLY